MRTHFPGLCLVALFACASFASAADFKIVEVPAIGADASLPDAIGFVELHADETANPAGLMTFQEWSSIKPLQKKFLSPYPTYVEPITEITNEGVTKTAEEKLRMYVAEARFVVSRPPDQIDLARYATIDFLARLDPAIEHQPLLPDEADNTANKNPDRPWCEELPNVTCVRSQYRLEGKLPMAVQLVKQLTDDEQLSEYLQFQSELRILRRPDLDQDGFEQLTGIDAPVTGAIEQTIFSVNQIMQFGKFLAVFQKNPSDSNETVVTAYVALALKARLLEQAGKYGNVPVLRNIVPAMVLMGKSTFNSGESISAGLPVFARNNVKAVAAMLEGPRPFCPSCFPLETCQSATRSFKLGGSQDEPIAVSHMAPMFEPDLLQLCRPNVDPFPVAMTCQCRSALLEQGRRSCDQEKTGKRPGPLRAQAQTCAAPAQAGSVRGQDGVDLHALNDDP